MPRQPRPDLACVPQHVVQRGNDRQACFFEEGDCRAYLTGLREASLRYGCAVHAYVLMANHVHLLLTPAASGGVSRMMQQIGVVQSPFLSGGSVADAPPNRYGHVTVRTDAKRCQGQFLTGDWPETGMEEASSKLGSE